MVSRLLWIRISWKRNRSLTQQMENSVPSFLPSTAAADCSHTTHQWQGNEFLLAPRRVIRANGRVSQAWSTFSTVIPDTSCCQRAFRWDVLPFCTSGIHPALSRPCGFFVCSFLDTSPRFRARTIEMSKSMGFFFGARLLSVPFHCVCAGWDGWFGGVKKGHVGGGWGQTVGRLTIRWSKYLNERRETTRL